MSARLIPYATRDEWAADRRSGAPDFEVGASDAAGLVGISPWASPWDSYASGRVGGGDPPSEADARRGHLVEATAVALWAADVGARVWSSDGLWSPDSDAVPRLPPMRARAGWLAVTPDALAILPDGRVVCVEAKAPRSLDGWPEEDVTVRDPDAEGVPVPPHYAVQVACQLYALLSAGVQLHAVILTASSGWAYRRVVTFEATPQTRAWAQRIVAHVGAARRRVLLERQEPAPDASAACLAALRARLPEGPVTVGAGEDEAALMAAFAEAREQAAEAATALDELRPRLLSALTARGARAMTSERYRLTASKAGALSVRPNNRSNQ